MPKFRKTVLKPGRYLVNDLQGNRKEEVFSPERVKRMAEQHKEMVEAGLSIPSPWFHDGNEATIRRDILKDSKNNAGWWEVLELDAEGNLVGEVDIPLVADATKVGKTVKEVSPLIKKKYIDGNGRVWDDVVTHVALVTHPVQGSQDEFKPVKTEDEISIAMSCYLGIEPPKKDGDGDGKTGEGDKPAATDSSKPSTIGSGSAYSIQEALKCLRTTGIDLPDDTSPENLIERIVVACRAIQGNTDESDQIDQEGQGTTEQPQPIAMSGDAMADALVEKQIESYRNLAQNSVQKNYKTRILSLVSSGKITKTYAQQNLEPLLQGFQLSLDSEGDQIEGQIDFALKMLENLPTNGFLGTAVTASDPKTKQTANTGSALSLFDEEEYPAGLLGEDLAQEGEDLDASVTAQLTAAGLR